MKKILKSIGLHKVVILFASFFNVGLEYLNRLLRWTVQQTHRLQMWVEWRFLSPEWMNHFADQFFQWRKHRVSFWLERGIFGSLALGLKKNPKVLELCCGDGFNTYHFYSKLSDRIIALDFDKRAINHARKNNNFSNIEYRIADIRHQFPEGKFDNIMWDAAIEHFTESEISDLMTRIKNALSSHGVLSGYTLVEKDDGEKHLHQHEYEFKSKNDLYRFISPHFKKVKVFETFSKERHNLYFFATQEGVLPFDSDWDAQVSTNCELQSDTINIKEPILT